MIELELEMINNQIRTCPTQDEPFWENLKAIATEILKTKGESNDN
jgi:hypothetical protein